VYDMINGYHVKVLRPPDEAVLSHVEELHCRQGKVRVRASESQIINDYKTIDDDTAVLFFKNPHFPREMSYSDALGEQPNMTFNTTARLTLPDGSGAVDITITMSKPINDVAYLSERELPTPGVIDIQVVS